MLGKRGPRTQDPTAADTKPATIEGVVVVLPELSESLGLGWSSGAGSSVQRTLRRGDSVRVGALE